MESLPTEILAHVFEQFPKCEICSKNCLRASKRLKALSKCSDTCARWNKILEGKVGQFSSNMDLDFLVTLKSKYLLAKCFSYFGDWLLAVNIDMKNAKSWGLTVLELNTSVVTSKGIFINSIQEDGPVALDDNIIITVGDSILQVNEIKLVGLKFKWALRILKDVVENQKFQTVRLVVGKFVSFSDYPCYGHLSQINL